MSTEPPGWLRTRYGDPFGWMVVLVERGELRTNWDNTIHETLEAAQAAVRKASCDGRTCFLTRVYLVPTNRPYEEPDDA